MIVQSILRKLREWLNRYFLPEVAAISSALAGSYISVLLSDRPHIVMLSFIAAWSENIGYYSVVLWRDFRAERKVHPRPFFATWGTVLKHAAIEFGPAESIDSFVLRPACMYAGFNYFSNPTMAVLAGKLSSDIGFYALAIAGYELRRKIFPAKKSSGMGH